MKVLMIHVGNEVEKNPALGDEHYLKRLDLLEGNEKYYLKQDIINADTQMNSIIEEGINVEYGHFSNRKSISSLLKAGITIRRICKEKKIDVVHVMWGTTTALITVLFSPKPVVISFCGSDLLGTVTDGGKLTKGGKLNRFFSQISALKAKAVITKSEHMKNVLWPLNRSKTIAIPNGINLTSFLPTNKEEAKRQIGWENEKKIIIFFSGNNALVKDMPLAEKVFALVKEVYPEVAFKVLNKIPHQQLPLYYSAGDVMLLTSFHEGSNNSLKEAMACNLPIVSVNVGDAKERLDGVTNSYIVDSRDPKDLADKVIAVLEKCERSNGNLKTVDLSLSSIAQKIIKVYKSII